MLLAIFLIVLVSIVIISFSTQVGNQIKSTMKADKDIQEKYNAESEIEEGIAEFIEIIEVLYKDDIYKDTGTKDNEGYPIYEQYLYYKIKYSGGDDDVHIANKNEIDRDEDGYITIFYRTEKVSNTNNVEPIDGEPEFDIDKLSKGVILNLVFTEEDKKSSNINLIINNISGEVENQEECSIYYEVKKWRS